MSKTIRALVDTHPKVDDVSIETFGMRDGGDGYWVYLKPGWINSSTECHNVHEHTVKETLRALREDVEPCECKDRCFRAEEKKR